MRSSFTSSRFWALLAALTLVVVLPAGAGAKPSATTEGGGCGTSPHPSGNDRCVEEGGSGTQGDATSDPDDNGNPPERSNGGADQPGGPGGVNAMDQDGNNGCGNDQDFEDDNEGLCGDKPDKDRPATAGQKPHARMPAAREPRTTPAAITAGRLTRHSARDRAMVAAGLRTLQAEARSARQVSQ